MAAFHPDQQSSLRFRQYTPPKSHTYTNPGCLPLVCSLCINSLHLRTLTLTSTHSHYISHPKKKQCYKKKVSQNPLYLHWVVSLPSNSHHQDWFFFSRGSRTKWNLHLPLASWEGGQPKLYTNCGPSSPSVPPKKKIQAAELHVIRSTTGLMHPPTTNTLLVTTCFLEGRPPQKK